MSTPLTKLSPGPPSPRDRVRVLTEEIAMHVADLTTTQWFVAAWIAVGAAYAVARSIQHLKEKREDW